MNFLLYIVLLVFLKCISLTSNHKYFDP